MVVTAINSNQVRVYNSQTQALLFTAEGDNPYGVAVTADGSRVVVAEHTNNQVAVLQLVANADASDVRLDFIRSIGKSGLGDGKLLSPRGLAIRKTAQGETVLVANTNNNCISEFRLDGFFVRSFGTCGKGDGQFKCPYDLTVLPSGDVAVVDCDNHRVQIFDEDGIFVRKFGTRGKEVDGQFHTPFAITSDAQGNLLVLDNTHRLQVFDVSGQHLCTRSDLSALHQGIKGVAWCDGQIAIANGPSHNVLLWHSK
jgi:DNA-binding beta-propeller fold protein YncE